MPEPAPSTAAAERPATQQQPAAGTAPPSRPAAPVRSGAVDADVLRQRWPDILDAVRQERKVAWLLLNPASVDSLEGGVLTIAFPREGEAKGFSTSGHDQVLTEVLNTMLGLSVRVRGVVGGSGGSGRPAPAARASDPGREPDAQRGGYAEAGGSSGLAIPATAKQTAATQEPAAAPASEVPAPRAVEAAGRRATGEAGRPQAQAVEPAMEEWPDDAGEPGGGTPMPTGMELIQRELGGKVIDEFEEP